MKRCIAGLLVAFVCTLLLPSFAGAAECTSSLQAKIDAASSGATVTADACTYREQVSITKPLTLVGQTGSEIRGSDLWNADGSGNWDGFLSGTTKFWQSTKTLPKFYQEDVSCDAGTDKCANPEQVFVDGTELDQVTDSTPAPGQFYVDSSRHVILADDPGGFSAVEVTTRKHWVTGGANADGVTIKGFTMKHAANEWRSGAIQSRDETTLKSDGTCCDFSRSKGDGSDWNILNNNLSYAHGAVVSPRGSNSNVENNTISHGGQLGVHNPGDNSLVKNNDIGYNNDQDYCYKGPSTCTLYNTDTDGRASYSGSGIVEVGGVKIAGGKTGITADSNVIHHNHARGLWSDVNNTVIKFINNKVHHNDRSGIFYEISANGTITGNVVYENGWGTPGGNGGGGIAVTSSQTVDVGNNTLAWNADGIFTEKDSRGALSGVNIHENRILSSDTPTLGDSTKIAIGIKGTSVTSNKSVNNKIYFPTAENSTYNRFLCNTSSFKNLAGWNGSACTPSTNDSYMGSAAKDSVVATYGVPASQESH